MAKAKFALPVGHVSVNGNDNVDLRVCVGRPFCQPIDIPNINNFSPGLELWLANDGSHSNLYAMFDGEVRFIQARPGAQNYSLQLNVEVKHTQQTLSGNRGLLEPVPVRIIYENVDRSLVRTALHNLIDNAGPQSRTLKTNLNGDTIKQRLQSAQDRQGTINEIVDAFLENDYSALLISAGDHMGGAASAPAGVPKPDQANCDFIQTARQVTIMIEEYAANKLNPVYYLWRLLMNVHNPVLGRNYVELVSKTLYDAGSRTFNHPLLNKLGLRMEKPTANGKLSQNIPDPEPLPLALGQLHIPGEQQPVEILPFPTGKLSIWRGMNWTTEPGDWYSTKWPKSKPSKPQADSQVEWGIANNSSLDFKIRKAQPVPNDQHPYEINGVNFSPQPGGDDEVNRITRVWNTWGNFLNQICEVVQLPVEIVAATIAHESGGGERALAIEPLKIPNKEPKKSNPKKNDELKLQNAGVSQAIIDAFKALTPRRSLTVPALWSGNTVIDSSKSTLTWNQLLTVLDVVLRVASPGLTQTLVGRAKGRVLWLHKWYPDLLQQLGVPTQTVGQPGPSQLPTERPNNGRGRDWFSWLLEGKNSVIASVAYHKYAYAYLQGRMDLIYMASAYNAGSLIYYPRNSSPIWMMHFNSVRYPRDMMQYYNALHDIFDQGAPGVTRGKVRFWKTLSSEYTSNDDVIQ